MAALFTSMLKTIILSKKSISKRLEIDDGEINEFGVGENGIKHVKKSGKLSKLRKSKKEKTSKFRNLAKSRKKSSKSGNSTNFNIIEAGPKFLTPNQLILMLRRTN